MQMSDNSIIPQAVPRKTLQSLTKTANNDVQRSACGWGVGSVLLSVTETLHFKALLQKREH